MTELADRECVPCKGGVPPLGSDEVARLLAGLDGWEAVDDHHLTKLYRFRNWAQAQAFANRVGDLAESVNHHPDLHLSWGKVRVEIWTHKIDGLTESDFVFAAKTDRVLADSSGPEPAAPAPPPRKPVAPVPLEPGPKQVFVADSPLVAHFVRGLLDNAGIGAEVRGEAQFAGLQWELPMDERLSVWIEDAQDLVRATQIVEEYHRVNRGEGRDPETRDGADGDAPA